MPVDIKAFSRARTVIATRTLPEAVAQAQRALAREVLRGVVERTPVASGRARANWQVSLSAPVNGVLDARDPSGSETIARGNAVINSAEPFGRLWITNALNYAEVLENGRSDQAPRGMVRATLASLSAAGRRGPRL